MSVVLDTCILIDLLRGVEAAKQYLLRLDSLPVCSEVSRIEILQGMRSTERSSVQRLLASLMWAPLDGRTAEIAGSFGRRYRKSHQHIGIADLTIAATAQVTGLPLATLNVRHFPMYSDLKPAYKT